MIPTPPSIIPPVQRLYGVHLMHRILSVCRYPTVHTCLSILTHATITPSMYLSSSSSSIPLITNSADVSLLLLVGDYSLTYQEDAACHSSDNCILSIPFTGEHTLSIISDTMALIVCTLQGSGITIYVYQSGPIGINASFAVDGNHSQTRVLNAPEAPNYAIANVSMFNIQQLTSGPHTGSLTVNDIFGSYSGMIWDYAYVNETLATTPAPGTTTSASTTSSSSIPTTSSTSSPSQYVYSIFTAISFSRLR